MKTYNKVLIIIAFFVFISVMCLFVVLATQSMTNTVRNDEDIYVVDSDDGGRL